MKKARNGIFASLISLSIWLSKYTLCVALVKPICHPCWHQKQLLDWGNLTLIYLLHSLELPTSLHQQNPVWPLTATIPSTTGKPSWMEFSKTFQASIYPMGIQLYSLYQTLGVRAVPLLCPVLDLPFFSFSFLLFRNAQRKIKRYTT